MFEFFSEDSMRSEVLHEALLMAARKGVSEIVSFLLEARAAALCSDVDLQIALKEAIQIGSAETVHVLLQRKGESLRMEARAGALQMACSVGSLEVVDLLLKEGGVSAGAVDLPDGYGGTALIAAAAAGKGDIVRVLLNAGADRTCRNTRGETALDIAIRRGQKGVVKILQPSLSSHVVSLFSISFMSYCTLC
uniref:Uncharacterized protein n=1 Tax=Chromera velia CCMP2878 TaxID=1169474 RepID=A0A0G4I7T4_9ALVE|eukprot:Cvel_11678.t1-p1 / transcript=Cvel_11678.t1 / gene=Cvel_11678 / organism=Chromera_velia_CCMP2878 / gene_product=Putative ankyrin repeat protein MM_0045, putative / transcript_product=Putative ankyrin repeat protein MM_0045, putative / location=Cvel_scaffold740:38270-38845(+) / protein_length=192 / sequence_SO=supercontig / SO=protein_coding / is_pseudo=false